MQKTYFYEWVLILHIIYILLVTVLLLNLIIAMMGQTFEKDAAEMKTKYALPRSMIVLNQERLLKDHDKLKNKNRCARYTVYRESVGYTEVGCHDSRKALQMEGSVCFTLAQSVGYVLPTVRVMRILRTGAECQCRRNSEMWIRMTTVALILSCDLKKRKNNSV